MTVIHALRWSLAALLLTAGLTLGADAHAARLKDVIDIEGVRDNQLVGFGLVVGLKGTGDSGNRAAFTTQSLVMMLERMGISARDSMKQISTKNVASAMVTATLPAFARQGARLDVQLSSLGDAKSLEGGTLILTPLKGADGKIYAVAQGAISLGGGQDERARNSQSSHPTVGRVAGGGIVEREIGFNLNQEKSVQLSLKNRDFTTANRVSEAVNNLFGESLATAKDSGTIQVELPKNYQGRVVEFLSRLENLEVESDNPARIVINERTGTIVMGEKVRIATVALSHGNLSIRVTPPAPAQPEGTRQPARQPVQETITKRVLTMEEGVALGDLVEGLNSVGATPKDLIAILQAIKAVGALHAELEIL